MHHLRPVKSFIPLILSILLAIFSASGRAHAAGAPAAAESEAEVARRLLRRWAPTFVQHVASDDRGRDRPTRFDFDGDFVATNNWKNQPRHGTRVPPHAYGAAILTETHAYLSYSLFYPRDWLRPFCLPIICHENDLESMVVVVRRARAAAGGREGDGKLLLVETKPHLKWVGVRGHQVALDGAGHPLVRVEAYKHGTYPCRKEGEAPEGRCRPGKRRLLYVVGDRPAASQPEHPRGETVTYALLSLRDTLWRLRSAGPAAPVPGGERAGLLWDPATRFHYAGLGGGSARQLGTHLAASIYRAAAVPPWGLRAPVGKRGDWFLDPAHVILARYRLEGADEAGARRYVHHPFLDDLRGATVARDGAAPPAGAHPTRH